MIAAEQLALIRRSLVLDVALIRQRALSRRQRASILLAKYRAVPALLRGRPAVVRTGTQMMRIRDLASLGTWHSCIVDFAAEIVSTGLVDVPAPVVVDVGANIGQFCAAAKLFFPRATVFCFEPDPDVYQELVRNTADFDSVVTFNLGLDCEPAERTFYRHPWSVISSFAPYNETDYDSAETLMLRTSTLDEALPNLFECDLLKVDVEGFELPVVQGARRTLTKTKLLLVEIRLSESSGSWPNLAVFRSVLEVAPDARLVGCGRPLGPTGHPMAQDMVIQLFPTAI